MRDSRAEILAAATQEFARHGLRGTRVQAIVDASGVNERMIYHHFGSKEGLYEAVLDSQRRAGIEQWLPVLGAAAQLEPYEGMRAALTAFAMTWLDKPYFLALLLHEALDGFATFPMPSRDMLPAAIRDLYARGQRQGVFRRDCSFEIAYGIAVGTLVTFVVFLPRFTAWTSDEPADTQTLLQHCIDQLLDGMTGPVARRTKGHKP